MSIDWRKAAAGVRWRIDPFIQGRYVASTSEVSLEKINPADETVLYETSAGNPIDVDAAVRTARSRFDDGCWSNLLPGRRIEVLFRLADLILEYKVRIALLDSLEVGRPIAGAIQDVVRASGLLRSWGSFAEHLQGVSSPFNGQRLLLNLYQPRGVVGAITPWNFPVVNAVFKLAPALAAGNTLVLKPSELSPSSALKIAELALEAGMPEGVLNIVPGAGSTVGAALALHQDVDLISFTGSTVTGRKVMELSGRSNGKPLLLECGGKSPQVVFEDVDDLDRVAEATVSSLVRNQGQVCSAHTRLLVHERIKNRLLEKVVERASQYHPGHPLEEDTTFGPLASPAQRDRVKGYIAQGVQDGAVAVLSGTIQERNGCYVSPTVFDRVSKNMSIARDEIFGPVLCVQSFNSEEEAIGLANATPYGLMATVWTRDLARGKRLASAIRAGHVSVRTSGEEEEDGALLGFEPQKASGFGAELGLAGLKSYSTLKCVSFAGT